VVDSEVWDRISVATDLPSRTLHALLLDERVQVSLYSDDGPPADAKRKRPDLVARGDEAIGWTVLSPVGEPLLQYLITTATESSIKQSGLSPDQIWMARTVLKIEGATDENDFDARLIATVQEVKADILVTEREAILSTELEDRANCRFASAAEAIALVALYLRASGEYLYVKDRDFTAHTSTASRFYHQVSEHLIPSLGEFTHRAEGVVTAARLATIYRRARGLLEARDRLALLTSLAITDDVVDSVEATFTHALVDMVAFHDVLARIVNEFLESPQSHRSSKWQHSGWRPVVLSEIPAMSAAWTDGQSAFVLNEALRAARNEIHDIVPTSVG
jgi:hypothetical protein